MSVKTDYRDDTLTAWLQGDIDHYSAAAMREAIDKAAEGCLPKKLILDFSGVSFMDSSGVGLVMGRYRLISSMGGALTVTGASPRIRAMMKMAGLDLLGAV
ncbi:MAG: anti-sigma factor antagonist [Oscillospiraceae bacterium]|jgi:stage II sporulation protein AA (anti-sigma F factor antagonist)|nr:anti-sigma factor antagonist [Oscillospiraceae bacterium]